jgi:hypothetical protein
MKKYSQNDDSCHMVTRLAVEGYSRANNFPQFSLLTFPGTDTHCHLTIVEENGICQVENRRKICVPETMPRF